MADNLIRIGLLGAGWAGETHAQALQSIPVAQLVGVASSTLTSAERFASQFGITAYASCEELIQDDQVDVIDICLPTHLHHEYVLKAVDLGKHVFCEKPMARTLDEAESMLKACDRAKNISWMIGHVLRFFPEYVKARELLQSGGIGQPRVAKCQRLNRPPTGSGNWFLNPDLSGGVILDLMIHDFDFLRWCFGEVAEVKTQGTDFWQHARVQLRFENGVEAKAEGSWIHHAFERRLEIIGQEGAIRMVDSGKGAVRLILQKQSGASVIDSVDSSPANPYALELTHFLHGIQTGAAPMISSRDAYEALRISLAALESAKTGEVISLFHFW